VSSRSSCGIIFTHLLGPPGKSVDKKKKKEGELGAIEQGGRGGTRTYYFLLELLNKKNII